MKNNEVFEEIFTRYKPATKKLNDISPSLYPKDEFKLRHGVFKAIFNEYRSYRFKVFLSNIKERIKTFKARLRDKKKEKALKDYQKYFLDVTSENVAAGGDVPAGGDVRAGADVVRAGADVPAGGDVPAGADVVRAGADVVRAGADVVRAGADVPAGGDVPDVKPKKQRKKRCTRKK